MGGLHNRYPDYFYKRSNLFSAYLGGRNLPTPAERAQDAKDEEALKSRKRQNPAKTAKRQASKGSKQQPSRAKTSVPSMDTKSAAPADHPLVAFVSANLSAPEAQEWVTRLARAQGVQVTFRNDASTAHMLRWFVSMHLPEGQRARYLAELRRRKDAGEPLLRPRGTAGSDQAPQYQSKDSRRELGLERLLAIAATRAADQRAELQRLVAAFRDGSYYSEPHWRQRRKRAIELARNRCAFCGGREPYFHVHHLNYSRLGRELDEDLQVLCVECHGTLHPGKAEGWRAQAEMLGEKAAKREMDAEAREAMREARLELEREMRSLAEADWSGEGADPPL